MRQKINFELLFWIAALAWLACMNPAEEHFSFCLFHHLGLWCPGCGIGHSISWLLHGNIVQSFHTHYLGIFALAVIAHRIYILSKSQFKAFVISEF
jgi:hypothetical protein